MRLIDRYLLRLFLWTLTVCFLSMAGLYVVIDVFTNLEEFITLGEAQGGLASALVDYYGARVLAFFDRAGPFLVLLAAMFTLTRMQRTNEMTALFAAGIAPRQLVRPVVFAALAVVAISAVNREVGVPACRERLSRNVQDLLGARARPLHPRYDNRTDILLSGQSAFADELRISQPNFSFEAPLGDFGRRLTAENAYYRRAEGDRPGGYLLDGVREPENVAEVKSRELAGRLTVLTPRDFAWLEEDQCFLVTAVDFEQLTGGASWRQFSSTWQLLRGLRNPSLDFGADVRVEIHSRLVRPFLDLTLLFLGLPLALGAEQRNAFLVAGKGLLVALGFIAVVLACQGMGAAYWMRPALAAWTPLLIFVPLAVYLNQPLRK